MGEAATIPEAFATSYLNLCIEGGMKAGETVLIQAGASGLGIAAIQLVKALGGIVGAVDMGVVNNIVQPRPSAVLDGLDAHEMVAAALLVIRIVPG